MAQHQRGENPYTRFFKQTWGVYFLLVSFEAMVFDLKRAVVDRDWQGRQEMGSVLLLKMLDSIICRILQRLVFSFAELLR